MNIIHVVMMFLFHLYHYQWKDGPTPVCVGGLEDMDLDGHFTMP